MDGVWNPPIGVNLLSSGFFVSGPNAEKLSHLEPDGSFSDANALVKQMPW